MKQAQNFGWETQELYTYKHTVALLTCCPTPPVHFTSQHTVKETSFICYTTHTHIPGTSGRARSKAWVCGRSPAGTAVSDPAGSEDVCLLLSVVCCQVEFCATS
jgi:hypothetical protein